MVEGTAEEAIQIQMTGWWENSNSINILITGKTGTGKSTLVNAITGKPGFAQVGRSLKPETVDVTAYEAEVEGILVVVWDSPGLQDGLEKEEAYLQSIEMSCRNNVDLFIYCVSMTENRFLEGSRDIEAMAKLTDKLGKGIWNNAIFILTCANKFITKTKSTMPPGSDENKIKEIFKKRLECWKIDVKECLRTRLKLPADTIEKLPIVPAGKIGKPFFTGDYPWLSTLWMESLLATKRDAQPALIKMNLQHLKSLTEAKGSEEKLAELLLKEEIIIMNKGTEIARLLEAEETAGYAASMRVTFKKQLAHILEYKLTSFFGTAIGLEFMKAIVSDLILARFNLK